MSTVTTVFFKVFCSFLIPRTLPNNSKMPYYAVAKGRSTGIFKSWADCEAQVKGYSGAKFKKFDSADAAQDFVNSGIYHNTLPPSKPYVSRPKTFASSSNNNLKRSYSNSSNYENRNQPPNRSWDDDDGSDSSDDLNAVLTKQLDDVEKRLKGFGKNVDKIIKIGQQSGRKTIMIDPPQAKRMRSNNESGFKTDHNGYVEVYTDGACSGNGRSGARAGIGVYWGDGHQLNISEPVSGRATNNCGEIQAATKAIKVALQNDVQKLSINTDSKFLIDSVTKWIPGWKRKGWKLASGEPVKNEIDFKDLDSVQNQLEVKWNYVEAHRGVHGNEMADQLAKAGAARYTSNK